jgi:invasion protein IalB
MIVGRTSLSLIVLILSVNLTLAQQRTTAIYGDWTLSCVIVPSGWKSCGLVQSQKLATQLSAVSQIGVGRTTETGPLKVSIEIRPDAGAPSEVKLIGDDNVTIITAAFKWCTSALCLADADLSDTDIKSLRSQKSRGKLVYKNASQTDVSIPISFSGFSDALDALQKEYALSNVVESAPINLQTLRQTLSKEIPIDPDVLRTVQTARFFQNAPTMHVVSYRDLSKSDSGNFTMTVDTKVPPVGRGIAQFESSQIFGRNDSEHLGVTAGNGLITIAQRVENTYRGKTDTTTYQTQIENLDGHLFPVEVGTQFSYKTVSSASPDRAKMGGLVNEMNCAATEKRSASEFYRGLTGEAFVFKCNWTSNFAKDPPRFRNTYRIYFSNLGYFLAADTLGPNRYKSK